MIFSFLNLVIYLLYIPIAASLLSPPSPSLSPLLPVLLRERKGLPWISPGLGIPSVLRQGISSIVDRPGSLIRGGGFKAMQCSQRAPAPTFGVSYEEPVAQLLHMCRGPRSLPHMFSGWQFNLYEPLLCPGLLIL